MGQRFRSFNRWTQFGALLMGQLTGRGSLRDIVADMTPLKKRRGRKSVGILEDREITLGGSLKRYRLVIYRSDDGHLYCFLTNAFHFPAKTVTELYKERWQIELFFKWIKQHLKVKTFFGTSRHAVMT